MSQPVQASNGSVRVKNVKMKAFQSFEDKSVPIPPGLVFVCGPNESGKTGIMEAIRLALFTDAATQNQAVRQRARWGSDGDFCIQVILDDPSGDWLIERDFGSKRNKLVEPNGNVHRDKSEIAAMISGLLGLPLAGAEDAYMASAYVRQDQMQGGGEALKKLLEERVIGSGVDVLKLTRDAETEIMTLRKGRRGGSSKGELTLAAFRVVQLEDELARISADVDTVANARADVAESSAKERGIKEQVDVFTTTLAKAKQRAEAKAAEGAAQKQLEKILKQKSDHEELSRQLKELQPKIDDLSQEKRRLEGEKSRRDQFDRLALDIGSTRGQSERLFDRIQKAKAMLGEISGLESRVSPMPAVDPQSVDAVVRLDQRRESLEHELKTAKESLADLNLRRDGCAAGKKKSDSEVARLTVLVDVIRQVDRMRSLEGTLQQIGDASSKHDTLVKALQAVPCVQEDDLDAVRSLEAKINALSTSSSNLVVEVRPLGGQTALLEVDGQERRPIDSASELIAHKSVVVDVQNVLHMAVRTEDAERALGDLSQARARLGEILKPHGAADAREILEIAATYRKAVAAEVEARTRLEAAVGGKDVEALLKELSGIRDRVGKAAVGLGQSVDDIKAMSLPEKDNDLTAARDDVRRIDSVISKVDGKIAALDLDKKSQELSETKKDLAALLAASGSSSVDDMTKLRDRRQDLLGQIQALKARASALLEDRPLADVEADRDSLATQVKSLEAKRKDILLVGPVLENLQSELGVVATQLREAEDSRTGITARLKGIDLEELEREQTGVLTRQMLPAQQVIKDTEAFETSPQEMAKAELDLKRYQDQLDGLKEKRMKAHGILFAVNAGAEDYSSKSEELEDAKQSLARLQRHERVLEILRDTFPEARTRAVEGVSTYLAEIASSELEQVTDGKYGRVEVSRELVPRVFSDARGDWIDVEEERDLLSAGTLDQVLLAMRLSVAGFMSNGKRPPILMDDPFVHFDPERRGKAMELLQRAAKDYQIVVFTCHDYKEMVGAQIIRL